MTLRRSAPDARRDARVLVVGGGPFQLDAIRAAKRVVREVWVVDRDERAPGMRLADQSVALDFGRLELVVELARRERFDGVMTAASDAAVPAVAACVQSCSLSGTDPGVASRCRDKLATIQALAKAGLRVPHTREVMSVEAVLPAAERVGGFPFVLKPRSAAGGRGVTIVHAPADIPAAFARAMRHAHVEQGCLVQEWIAGHSVGVEAFLWGGRLAAAYCLSDQYCDGFVSPIGHALPCDLDAASQARVLQAVQDFCLALGLRSGPFNFDLRCEAGEVCLIEVNARLGGNSITPLIRTAYDIDLAEAAVVASLGENPAELLRQRREAAPCAARLIALRGGGKLDLAPLSQHVTASPDVLELELLGSGDEPPSRVDDWMLLGHCLVRAASAERAIARARSVADEVLSCVQPSVCEAEA